MDTSAESTLTLPSETILLIVGKMDNIYPDLLLTKEQGYTAIDISKKIEYIEIGSRNLDFIIVDGMYIYHKSKKKLDKLLKGKVDIEYNDNEILVTVKKKTKMYPLKQALSQDIDSLIIHCNDIYIPHYVFNSIKVNSLTLLNPVLDIDVLGSIHSHTVTMHTDKYHSFEPLDCNTFNLHYIPNSNSTKLPIMPKNSRNVELVLYTDHCKSNDFTFTGNNTIQKLKIIFFSEHSHNIHLEQLPALESLEIPFIQNKITMPIETMMNLKECIVSSNECYFLRKGDNICITTTMKEDDILFDTKLPNLHTFGGTFSLNKQYLLLSNVKKLTTDKLLKSRYIPSELEEYYIENVFISSNDRIAKFHNSLLSMKSIKRMPFILDRSKDIPIKIRFHVYYDIWIYNSRNVFGHDCLVRYNGKYEDTPGLHELLDHNEMYNIKYGLL